MKITQEAIKLVQDSLNRHYRHNLKVDGHAGRKTQTALLQVTTVPNHWKLERQLIGYIQHIASVEDINAGPVDGYWGPQTDYAYKIGAIPDTNSKFPIQTQKELTKFYGEVGTNQVKLISPYPLRLSWKPETVVRRITCHQKVRDSVERALTNVKNHYGLERIHGLLGR